MHQGQRSWIYASGSRIKHHRYIQDPWPWCTYLWCGAFSLRTNGHTFSGSSNRSLVADYSRFRIGKVLVVYWSKKKSNIDDTLHYHQYAVWHRYKYIRQLQICNIEGMLVNINIQALLAKSWQNIGKILAKYWWYINTSLLSDLDLNISGSCQYWWEVVQSLATTHYQGHGPAFVIDFKSHQSELF